MEKRQELVDHATFSIDLGTTSTITRGGVSFIPNTRGFRILYVEAEVAAPMTFIQGTTANRKSDLLGYWPGWFQMRLYSPVTMLGDAETNQAVVTSGAKLLGPNPRVIRLYNPPQQDWFPQECPPKVKLIGLDAGCVRGGMSNVQISGLLRTCYQLKTEESTEACPGVALPHYVSDQCDDFVMTP